MAYIPAAMNGNKIQHDIQFSNDGPITGIVGALQAPAALGSGTTTLILGGTAGASEIVMSSDFLAIDPAGDKTLRLPNVLGDVTLVGRTIKIFNSADAAGELITLIDYAENFICYVGYGDVVEIYISAHSSVDGSVEYVLLTKEFKHKVSTAGNVAKDILAAAGAGANFVIMPKFFVFKGTQDISSGSAKISIGAVDLVAAAKMPDLSAAGEQVIYSADFADVVIQDNVKVNYVAHGSASATVEITMVYSLVNIA
jgi:hypothetical protein